MNSRILGSMFVAGLFLFACESKKPEIDMSKATASAVVSVPSAAPVASAAPASTAARGVPSQADESIAAAKEIDKTNYKKELEAIEKDLK